MSSQITCRRLPWARRVVCEAFEPSGCCGLRLDATTPFLSLPRFSFFLLRSFKKKITSFLPLVHPISHLRNIFYYFLLLKLELFLFEFVQTCLHLVQMFDVFLALFFQRCLYLLGLRALQLLQLLLKLQHAFVRMNQQAVQLVIAQLIVYFESVLIINFKTAVIKELTWSF